jgi:molybdopterin biosynthesis enzyme
MTDQQWDIIFEQLRAPLKQGFEAVAEQPAQPVVSCQIAQVKVEIAPGVVVSSKLFCFLAHEPIAALIQSATDGAQKMSQLAAAQFMDAQEAAGQSRIVKPS